LILAVASSGLAMWAIRYANRPALVWFVSPAIGEHGRRIAVLVPRGWSPGDDPTFLRIAPDQSPWPRYLPWFRPKSESDQYVSVELLPIELLSAPFQRGDLSMQDAALSD